MPYIPKKERQNLEDTRRQMTPLSSGQLNYLLTQACLNYLNRWGESYSAYNSIIGALECAKLEMYRRRISVYEDKKIKENGDLD